MKRADALLVCCAIACFGCPKSDPTAGSKANAATQEERVADPLPSSELPEAIPANTSISYRIDVEAEHVDQLKLTPGASEQLSARGRRHVMVAYTAPQAVLPQVYETLRTHACDQARSRVERAPSRGGTILQLRAGGVRNVINDRDKFFPEPRWSDAYKACATALDTAFPTRGKQPAAQLRIEFGEKLSHAVNVSADVGPDLLGIFWDDELRVATLEVATIRPVEISIRSGKASERTLVDLKTHQGLKIGLTDEPRALAIAALEGPAATVGGEVPAGVDARTAAVETPVAGPSSGPKKDVPPADSEAARGPSDPPPPAQPAAAP